MFNFKSVPNVKEIVVDIMQMEQINQLLKEISKSKEEKTPETFVVVVDDPIGYYLSEVVNTITEKIKMINLTAIEKGDYLVFSKNKIELSDNMLEVAIAVGNAPVYSLVGDHGKVMKAVKAFVKANEPKKKEFCPCACEAPRSIYYDGEWLNCEEKVSIFTTFVKIGYRTYPIKNNYCFCGNDTVKIGHTIYNLKKDICGNKFLQKA